MLCNSYDFIIVGSGLSGLSFAYRLAPILRQQNKTLLIVDKKKTLEQDKHWCGWSTNPHPFDSIIKKRWHCLQVGQYSRHKNIKLNQRSYQVLESKLFYNYALNFLNQFDEVTIQYGCDVENISHKRLETSLGTIQGDWLLDARQAAPSQFKDPFMLWQCFYGWVIETKQPSFDESTVHFMNFHSKQENGILFHYLLPFSNTQALVEPTYFLHHNQCPSRDHFLELTKAYLASLGVHDFKIQHEEFGMLPMSTQPPRLAPHAITIGTCGGLLRPSTGYSFDGIQRHQDRLIRYYLKHERLVHIPPYRARSLWMDTLFLKVLQQNPQMGSTIFTQLFNNTQIDKIIRFMSDEGSWRDCLSVILGVPKRPFIKALL